MMAALMVAVGANAQARKITGMESCYKNLASKMEAKVAAPATANVVSKVNTAKSTAGRRAAADVAGTYILDFANYDRDFTSSSMFTIEAETGTITLDQYEKDPTTGEYRTFDYNIKLTDFTTSGGTAYGFYDEAESTILIPVQTLFVYENTEQEIKSPVVFSALVMDKEGSPLVFGYPMLLNLNNDGTIEIDEGDFTEEAQEDEDFKDAYMGGFWNTMPDYVNPNSGYAYAWNYGLDAEFFLPNATMYYTTTGKILGGDGSNWTKTNKRVYVEDYDTENVIHNFLGLCPVSVQVDKTAATCYIPLPQQVDDYNYSEYDESYDYGYMNLVGCVIDGNSVMRDYTKTALNGFWANEGMDFFKTVYQDATYYEEGDEIPEGKQVGDVKTEAGNYYDDDDPDYCRYFAVATKAGSEGAYMMGWCCNLYIEKDLDPSGIADVKTSVKNVVSKTYNLMGQEVNGAAKGLVIRDGKKMLVK